MTNVKRFLSICLTAVLLTTVVVFKGFALSQAATFTVTPSAKAVNIGDVVTVTVSATTNYYAAATAVPVYYDDTVFDFVPDSVTATGIFGEKEATRIYQENQNGMLYVALVPNSLADASAQILENTVLFSFQLKAKAYGVCEVGLHAEDQKTESNKAGILYCGAFASEDVASDVTAIGQVFTLQNTQITVQDGTPELVVIDGTTGVIDAEQHYVFGVTVGDAVENYFTVQNGTMEVALGTATALNGTGAKILVKNNSGDVTATYTLIIYGDVDGNGKVNLTDYGQVLQVATGTTSAVVLPERMEAADADHNAKVNLTDYGQVLQAATGTIDAIDQIRMIFN